MECVQDAGKVSVVGCTHLIIMMMFMMMIMMIMMMIIMMTKMVFTL